MNWSIQTRPTTPVLSAEEMLLHLRVDTTEESSFVERLLQAAESWVEEYTGRSLFTQTWLYTCASFSDQIRLPRAAPLQSVTHVKYYDLSNVLQTVSTSIYTVRTDSEIGSVDLVNTQSWPSSVGVRADAVRITYVTGWDDAANVPAPLKHAIGLLVGHWFLNREAVGGSDLASLPLGVEALCAPWRVWL